MNLISLNILIENIALIDGVRITNRFEYLVFILEQIGIFSGCSGVFLMRLVVVVVVRMMMHVDLINANAARLVGFLFVVNEPSWLGFCFHLAVFWSITSLVSLGMIVMTRFRCGFLLTYKVNFARIEIQKIGGFVNFSILIGKHCLNSITY